MIISALATSLAARRRPFRLGAIAAAVLFGATLGSAHERAPVVYAGTAGGDVLKIDLCTGGVLWTKTLLGSVECVAAARQGRYIVVGTTSQVGLFREDGSLLWTATPGVAVRQLVEYSQVAIDEFGQTIVVAHNDNSTRLYRLGSPVPVWTHFTGAISVAISWRGQEVFTGGAGGVAWYSDGGNGWDAGDGVPLWQNQCGSSTLTVDIQKVVAGGTVPCAVAGSSSGTVCLYNAAGTLIWTYVDPLGVLMSVSMNPSGDRVAAGNDDPFDSVGAQMELFSDMSDGLPGWSAADGVPAWTYMASLSVNDDLRSIEFESMRPDWMAAAGDDFASGGSGAMNQHVHNEGAALPSWSGAGPGEGEDVAYVDLDPYPSWVVYCDIGAPWVRIHRTDQAATVHDVNTVGNCRSVSAPVGALAGNIGTNYCFGAPNSAWPQGATISAWGTASVAANDIDLTAVGAAPTKPGLFYYGPSPVMVPFGNGFRCVGPAFFRVKPPVVTDVCGTVTKKLDLSIVPHSVNLLPGTTWFFQYWYRDPGAGGANCNLSDGLEITFTP